eukprot:CAMPEP_0198442960 /NCGR_PEP_ID=MMETSP1452-20131203/68796_1 /TAXON_ID=1181717 /ORGANISM="Synchroma pusillum, Strain CCMP3072" /LENGTH=253 /DNA_ID=CAMNT_0044163587 /DNA_START=1 /DNA_END=758 /DNA_ORIENTATION=-
MANLRRLMQEIDRTLKKVDEGVDLFDEIWEKVYSATNPAVKEKAEAELKKEIKRLQRLRDQIKTWIGSSDIRDKTTLIEARKRIEGKMEQFKVCEKETKTKAFSKEGLARNAQDPAEQEKQQRRVWITDFTGRLQVVIESCEADVERLGGGKPSRRTREEIERQETKIGRFRFHVDKLEQILRLMENDVLEPSTLDQIREDLGEFIEIAEDEDGSGIEHYDDETFYEVLNLEQIEGLRAEGRGNKEEEEEEKR